MQFRDDKSYPYLALSLTDEFPRVFITRKQKRSGIKYFGPFTHAWALRSTFDVALKIYPVRSCTDANFERARRSHRQCLLGDIGKCSAPCVGWISQADHRALAVRLGSFMEAGQSDVSAALEAELKRAAENEEFERAAKIRDQITSMERARESTDASLPENWSADVLAIYRDGIRAAASLFSIRKGSIRGSRSWMIDHTQSLEEQDDISALIASLYGNGGESEIPPEIITNELPQDVELLQTWLIQKRGSKVQIRIPQRGDKVAILDTVKRNAQYALIQYVNRRSTDSAISGQALIEIQEALGLKQPPLRIECFDISNISGTSVVASMVVFEDGMPKKSEYRRFIIDTSTAWDDTRAIKQVISRRIKRLLAESEVDKKEVHESGGGRTKFSYPPQLIVVDGGAPQVTAALQALNEANVSEIALCGLAKRLEEIWLPNQRNPLVLPRSSEGLYLLQRIRDEAHRFAITFHRSRRSRVMLESLLDGVPQLGQVRRAALLERFGSVAAIRKANLEEIAKIPGIGVPTAQIIFDFLSTSSTVTDITFDAQTGEIFSGP